ncbi:separin, partial [Heptranchias perlo]|uniref:separin n=1 Tax=Heptranchias perlo TaxID=212740 RepID=UPI003559A65F
EVSGTPEQAFILKQCYQNLEMFTSGVYDFLLETQGKDSIRGERLLSPCKRIVEKMVEVEEGLTGQGLLEFVGATALRVYNLAYGFYSHRLFSGAADVAMMLRGEVQPPNLFARSPLPLERVPKYFKLLVECCRKAGNLELAMESVAMWLMALGDQWMEQATEPIALWVCIKADAVKSGNEDLQLRTLKDSLQPWDLEPSALAGLLAEELRAYKRLRTDTAQERFNVICDLMKLCEEGSGTEQVRAVQLVELAQVLCYRDFSQHAECSALDCVEEALSVLGSLPETPDTRDQLQDDRAHASLWLYVCNLESNIQKSIEGCRRARRVASSVLEMEDGETNDLDYEDRQQGALSVYDCINFNLTAETKRCRPLDAALSLWKSILSETPAPRLRSSEQTVHALHLMAALYRLMDKPFQVIESYSLSLRLLDTATDSLSVVHVLLQLAEMLLQLDYPGPVQACLDEAELILKATDSGKSDYLLLKMTSSTLRSQLMCTRHQVPEGLALLLEVLQCPSLQKSSKVWYLLKAKVQQLVASYLSLSPAVLPAHLRHQLQDQGWKSPESALTDSHKVLCGIVMLLCSGVLTFGKSNPELNCPLNPGDNLFQKWMVLANLLTCSRRLVSLLSAIGSVQEAKMFCLETLRLTAKLHCVRPCAEFLVANAELELQRGDPGACNLDLQQVLLLLESCADFGCETPAKGGGRIKLKKGRAGERSHEAAEDSEQREEPPDFLRVRQLSPLDTVSAGGGPWAQAASPVLKPKLRGRPALLSHPAGCPCPVCSDLPLSATCLKWGLVHSELEGAAGRLGESRRMLRAVRERCRVQSARFSHWLQCLVLRALGESRQGGESGESAAVGPLAGIVARTYSQSAWLSLGSEPPAQTWKLLETGLDWFTSKTPVLQDLEHTRAALLLTKAAAIICQLVARRHCGVADVFSSVWGWRPGLSSTPRGEEPSPGTAAESGARRVKGPSSSSSGRALRRRGAGEEVKVAGGAEKVLIPMVHTPARARDKPRAPSKVQRPKGPFEVLEEGPESEWTERPLPSVRVPVRIRSRLKKQFDDSDVEEEGTSERAGVAGRHRGRAARSGTARQSTAKPRRQTRSAAQGPRKLRARSERPEKAGRVVKHQARAGRLQQEESLELGIEVSCASDTEQEETQSLAELGSSAVGVRDVPECEVLRRCDSSLHPECGIPPVEWKDTQSRCHLQRQPIVLASSTDVAALDAVYSCLSQACCAISHCPPSTLYSQACQLMALCLGPRDPYTTAYLLSESMAITTRHQMIHNLHRKAQKNKKARALEVTERLQGLTLCDDTDPQSQYLDELDSVFKFSLADPAKWPQDNRDTFKDQLQQIPDGVVVCLLTLAGVSLKDTGDLLLLSRLEKGKIPVTVQIPAEQGSVSVSSLLGEFDAILREQKEISKVTELKAWWDGRTSLDQRMKELLESLETGILGCWKGLLLPVSEDPRLKVEAAAVSRFLGERGYTNVDEQLLQAVLRAPQLLTAPNIQSLAEGLCGESAAEVRIRLQEAVDRLKTLSGPSSGQSSQLVLILDKHLQRLPWESVPILRAHRVSRLPSLRFLLGYMVARKNQLKSVLTEGVNPDSVFYVLNPQGNLPNTEKTFKDWFQRKDGWEGVVGSGPSEEKLRSVLSNRDLYVYAGHGAGVRFLEGQEIQKLNCRAASLLVGCSSATLALRGNLEGAGIVLKYMMAGCPLFLGNLWDVTDKDIDRYMEHLLRGWLQAGSQASILDYISRARQAPKLKYLIGASPVVYGLSVSLQ